MVRPASNSTPSLAGRVALVTGVSRVRGLGATLARRLLADGASVYATGFASHDDEMPWGRDQGGSAAVVTALDPGDGRLVFREADLADPSVPDQLCADAVSAFGGLDIVVANAARSSQQGFREVTSEELDLCWQVNARASLLLARGLSTHRTDRPWGGRVVLFTSGQHIGPMPDEIAYAVTKGAIHQMTASLSDALIDEGITVNCVNPGPTDTGWAGPNAERVIAQMFPAGRWGRPEDATNLVAFLVGDEGGWITGQVLNSEGGFRRWARPELRS